MENHNVNPQVNSNPQQPQGSIWERMAHSPLFKFFLIGILVLFLFIPLFLVNDLIAERKGTYEGVQSEISSKWGKRQVLSGPVIAIPYSYLSTVKSAAPETAPAITVESDYLFIVPEQLQTDAVVSPSYLKRGIYKSVVYTSSVDIKGSFGTINLQKMGVEAIDVNWAGAKMLLGMSDLKGLKGSPVLEQEGKKRTFENNTTDLQLFERTMSIDLDLKEGATAQQFHISYQLKGSGSINVFPLADHNDIHISGSWSNPSFNGAYLPDERTVAADSFEASWSIPSFDRSFPQQWAGYKGSLYSPNSDLSHYDESLQLDPQASSTDFIEVNFLESMTNYQKTTRVAKYGILIIILTFASLLFTELIKKQRIHVVHYILIGLSMILFYGLLLSLSEHVSFNNSYALSALATVAAITLFIFWVTRDRKLCLLFSSILMLFYGFVFVLLQLMDYSLLAGTIGLFIVLMVMMRLTTKISLFR